MNGRFNNETKTRFAQEAEAGFYIYSAGFPLNMTVFFGP